MKFVSNYIIPFFSTTYTKSTNWLQLFLIKIGIKTGPEVSTLKKDLLSLFSLHARNTKTEQFNQSHLSPAFPACFSWGRALRGFSGKSLESILCDVNIIPAIPSKLINKRECFADPLNTVDNLIKRGIIDAPE